MEAAKNNNEEFTSACATSDVGLLFILMFTLLVVLQEVRALAAKEWRSSSKERAREDLEEKEGGAEEEMNQINGLLQLNSG